MPIAKLSDFRRSKAKIDLRAGKITLKALADRYGATISHLAASTSKGKRGILARLESDWPEGEEQSVAAIKPSHCDLWIAKQAKRVGRSHSNAYVQLLRDLLEFAVRDRIISDNPAAHLKYLKREIPMRQTPTWEEFFGRSYRIFASSPLTLTRRTAPTLSSSLDKRD